jgi:DNA-binding response OmpR family regulator
MWHKPSLRERKGLSMQQRILICEDDPKLAGLLQSYLERYGYGRLVIERFDQVLDEFKAYDPHLVLLDVNLPMYDGFYWCRQIRTVSKCPIIFISARAGEMDQVMALEYGGDDYITKPFHHEVVMAKIRSQLRRVYGEYAPSAEERKIALEGLTICPERMEIALHDRRAPLTRNELVLLERLIQRYPRVASREVLLETLWDDAAFVDENTLNVNIARTRRKLQELGIENAIETVRGAGYRLQVTWGEGASR